MPRTFNGQSSTMICSHMLIKKKITGPAISHLELWQKVLLELVKLSYMQVQNLLLKEWSRNLLLTTKSHSTWMPSKHSLKRWESCNIMMLLLELLSNMLLMTTTEDYMVLWKRCAPPIVTSLVSSLQTTE